FSSTDRSTGVAARLIWEEREMEEERGEGEASLGQRTRLKGFLETCFLARVAAGLGVQWAEGGRLDPVLVGSSSNNDSSSSSSQLSR
ncbi:dnaj homolog subfamily b member 4-like, partial [Nannochloropsis oceanica]